jgi:hypothetical protein
LVADDAGFEPLRRVPVAGVSEFDGEAQRGHVPNVDSRISMMAPMFPRGASHKPAARRG